MKRVAPPVIGLGIVLVLVGAAAAVVAAPASSGVKACENSRGDLAVLSGGHCPKHYGEVTIAKSGPRGAKGSRGPAGPGATTLYFNGAATSSGGKKLAKVGGVTYTFSCLQHTGPTYLIGELDATGPTFDLHEVVSTASDGGALSAPSLAGSKDAESAPVLDATAADLGSSETVLTPAMITVHGPPASVQLVTGDLMLAGGNTAATSSCELEAQITPSS